MRIYLTDGASGEAVPAELLSANAEEIVGLWSSTWTPVFEKVRRGLEQAGIPREKWPEDAHWDWADKLSLTKGLLAYETYCIKAGSSLEGLMMIHSPRNSKLERGRDLVYVEFLATAPWNRKDICHPRKHRGVGEIFLEAAIRLSLEYELAGRIGLHSLPGASAFYRHVVGMTDLGPDPSHQDLIYFETTPEQAKAFLEG